MLGLFSANSIRYKYWHLEADRGTNKEFLPDGDVVADAAIGADGDAAQDRILADASSGADDDVFFKNAFPRQKAKKDVRQELSK